MWSSQWYQFLLASLLIFIGSVITSRRWCKCKRKVCQWEIYKEKPSDIFFVFILYLIFFIFIIFICGSLHSTHSIHEIKKIKKLHRERGKRNVSYWLLEHFVPCLRFLYFSFSVHAASLHFVYLCKWIRNGTMGNIVFDRKRNLKEEDDEEKM